MTYRNMGCALGLLWLFTTGTSAYSASTEDNPRLSVSRSQGTVQLNWPDWATNWAVEESAQLQNAANWTPLAAGTNSLRRTIQAATNGFFRLRKLSPAVAGLSGYWRFDEGTGTTSGDDVPNAPAVFFTNSTWGIGRVGPQALRFNGSRLGPASAAWVANTNYSLLPPNGPFSISLWFNPEALTNNSQLLVGNGLNTWAVSLQTIGPGTNNIVFASGSVNFSGRTLVLPGQWYELTVTYDGDQVRLYLDANLLATGTGPVTTDDRQILIGGGIAPYNSFLGRIDEVRTYKTTLTHERISLTGDWSFDENVGTVAYDRSVFGHHAHLSAAAWTAGKLGTAVQVSSNEVVIDNPHFTVLPPSGQPFSVSMWIYPHSLPVGRSGLISAGDGTNSNWELTLDVDSAGQTALALKSAAGSGTLDMRANVALSNRVWTKLDLASDGGIATIYVNGRKVHHDSGLIQSGLVPLRIGRVPGVRNFDGLVDELKIYRRERGASEIGPIATVMWETVLRGSTTNFTLQGSGPPGKTLTYSILSVPTPTNGTVSQTGASSAIIYQAGTRKGPDTLIFTVSDGEFTSVPATFHLSIVEPHWISPTGGSVQPLDGSAPARAWPAASADAVDAIWHTNIYYDCFFYAPGAYETRGQRYSTRGTTHPGCKHIGSGSEGPQVTIIRAVDMWEMLNEEHIFGPQYWGPIDDFEIHNLVLDCNAENNPKYLQGEAIWVRVPLTQTALVHSITIRWNIQSVPGTGPFYWQLGAAREFRVCTRTLGGSGYVTNCISRVSTGQVDVVSVEAVTDQILIQLDRRASGIDFYSIADIQLTGGIIALPSATLSNGAESRLNPANPAYAVVQAFDGNTGTAWASGAETNVQITMPVDPLTPINTLKLHWNCQTISGGLQLGPALDYNIRARRLDNGQWENVLFTRVPRTPDGVEDNVFSSPVQTDQLVIELTAREPDVQAYSLREMALLGSTGPVSFRIPAALNTLPFVANGSILQAFDGAPETAYVSSSQGMVGAIAMVGSNLKFTHLKVIGFGTKAARECFVVWVYNNDPTLWVGNVLIDDCLFTEPATHNGDGITCVTVTGRAGSITNGVIRRCTVRGLAPAFVYDNHAFSANALEDCLVEDCQHGLYFEPDSVLDYVGPLTLRSNRFNRVLAGVLLRFHPGRQFGPITCADNEIVLSGGGGWGFASGDVYSPGRSASVTNVTMLRNVIRYSDWQPRPTYPDMGIFYSDIQNGVFVNNLVVLGTPSSLRVRNCPVGSALPPSSRQQCSPNPPIEIPGEDVPSCLDTLPPGYRRVWLNNRDLSGKLLQVRFSNAGVDTLASQQQPPGELP